MGGRHFKPDVVKDFNNLASHQTQRDEPAQAFCRFPLSLRWESPYHFAMAQSHGPRGLDTIKALLSGLEDLALFPLAPAPRARPTPALDPSTALNQERSIESAQNCTLCGRHRSRRKVIQKDVRPGALITIVGDAPMEEEDKQGKAFVGQRGALLEKMLAAIGLARHEVNLFHVVKCFSSSALITREERQTCYRYLEPELREAKSGALFALGQTAAQVLARSDNPLGALRGRIWDFEGTPVIVSHDPYVLLQRPELKKEAWADLKLLQKQIGALE